MKFKIGLDQRNRRQPHHPTQGVISKPRVLSSGARDLPRNAPARASPLCAVLFRPVNQNAVPINLQICRDANFPRACGQLARKIGGHGARTARGKAHVIHYALPCPARIFLIWEQGFHIRRHRFHSRLRRGVHAVRRKIFDLAMQQQPQRPAVVSLAQIER